MKKKCQSAKKISLLKINFSKWTLSIFKKLKKLSEKKLHFYTLPRRCRELFYKSVQLFLQPFCQKVYFTFKITAQNPPNFYPKC